MVLSNPLLDSSEREHVQSGLRTQSFLGDFWAFISNLWT